MAKAKQRPNYQYYLRPALSPSQPLHDNDVAQQAITAIQASLGADKIISASLISEAGVPPQLDCICNCVTTTPYAWVQFPWSTPWRMVALLCLQW